MLTGFAIAASAVGAGHIVSEFRPPNWSRFLLKPLVLMLLMSAVVIYSGPLLLLAALFFCWLGDIALMMPSRSNRWFLAGLTSFLIGHLFYVALLFDGVMQASMLAWFCCSVIAVVAGAFIARASQTLWPAVSLYILTISLMLLAAVGSVQAQAANMLLAIGAILFAISDFLLGFNRFVRPLRASQFWVLSTYYAAQIAIVIAILG